MTAPFPAKPCCNGVCWPCYRTPNYFIVPTASGWISLSGVFSGADYPVGTFTIGSAANSVLDVTDSWCTSPSITANRNGYTWSYKKVQAMPVAPGFTCTTTTGTDFIDAAYVDIGVPGSNTRLYFCLTKCELSILWENTTCGTLTITDTKEIDLRDCPQSTGPGLTNEASVRLVIVYRLTPINCSASSWILNKLSTTRTTLTSTGITVTNGPSNSFNFAGNVPAPPGIVPGDQYAYNINMGLTTIASSLTVVP